MATGKLLSNEELREIELLACDYSMATGSAGKVGRRLLDVMRHLNALNALTESTPVGSLSDDQLREWVALADGAMAGPWEEVSHSDDEGGPERHFVAFAPVSVPNGTLGRGDTTWMDRRTAVFVAASRETVPAACRDLLRVRTICYRILADQRESDDRRDLALKVLHPAPKPLPPLRERIIKILSAMGYTRTGDLVWRHMPLVTLAADLAVALEAHGE